MAHKLKTEWKCIGRSGPTVDGRTIQPEWLEQVAANYAKSLYTAMMWSEHTRGYNLGLIEELRTAANDEGGIDLFAIIAPNDYYREYNNSGQKLFTSMELKPDFRDTNEFYLTGCAATDNPASAGTDEIRFSAFGNDDTLLYAASTEFNFNDDTQSDDKRLLARIAALFSKNTNEDDMDKQLLESMKSQLDALTQQFKELKPAKPSADDGSDKSDQFSVLADQLAAFDTRFAALESKLENDDSSESVISVEQFNTLNESLTSLTTQFNAALQEQPGTPAGEHTGDADNLDEYV